MNAPETTIQSNENAERSVSALSFVRSIKRAPYLWIGLCCLWTWPWLSAHDLAFYPQASQTDSVMWLGWLTTFLFFGLALLLSSLFYRAGRYREAGIVRIVVASTLIAISSVLFLVVVNIQIDQGFGVGFWWLALFLWPFCAAVGQAALYIAWGKLLGLVGARSALLQGIVATVVGALVTWAASFLPQGVIEIMLIALPLASGAFLVKSRVSFSSDALSAECSGVLPHAMPWKLLGTSLVMGCAFGILQSLALAGYFNGEAWSAVGVPSFLAAALVLLLSALWFRMDFNRMIYKIGFFVMALGFLLIFLGSADNLIGYAVLCTGYRYSDLLLWGLCAYLMYRRGYAAPWIIGICMGPLLLGRFVGFLLVTLLASSSISHVLSQDVVVVMGFVLLGSALFFESHNNLIEAWGIERLGSTDEDERAVELSCGILARTYGLSPRETEVLGFLAQGATRKDISEKLVLSEETIKTHIQHLYEKLSVHSRRDLLSMVDNASAQVKTGHEDQG